MASRDLTYNISANVTGADDVKTLAGDLDTVSTSVDEIGTTTASITVEEEGATETATAIGTLKESLENIPVVGPTLSGLADNLDRMGDTGQKAAGAISGILTGTGALAVVGVAIGGVSAAWEWYSGRAEEAARKAEEAAAAHRDLTDALQEGDVTAAASQFTDLYGDVIDQADAAGVAVDEVTEFITGQADTVPTLTGSYQELTDEQTIAIARWRQMGTAVGGYTQEELAALAAQQDHNVALDETSGALTEAREQYAEQGVVLHENEEQLGLVAAGLTDAADAEGELADGAAGSTEELEAQRQELAEAEAGAKAYADAIGSVDFQAAELKGATTAMSAYSNQLFAAGNAVQASEEAFGALAEAIGEGAVNFDTATEAGRAQQDALEGVAQVLDTELAVAYDAADGSQQAFMASADTLRTDTLTKLQDEYGLTAAEAEEVAAALGLTTGDFEARYKLSGTEEARVQLGLLQTAIEGLPDNVETLVTQKILLGDYQGALAIVQDYYDATGATVPVDADMSQAQAAVNDFRRNIGGANIVITGSGGGSSRRGGGGVAMTPVMAPMAAGPMAATTAAAPMPMVTGGVATMTAPTRVVVQPAIPSITIQAAVIGNPHEVDRVVNRALRRHQRVNGRRR